MIYIRKLTNEEFLNRMKIINPNIEFLSEYTRTADKIKCKCKVCGNEWETISDNLLRGKGCKICYYNRSQKERKKSHKQFVEEMKLINKNIEVIGNYNGSKNKIQCKCLIHDKTFFGSPTHLLHGKIGCEDCISLKNHLSGLKTHEQFLEDLYKINKNIIVLGEYNGAKSKIKVKCKKCGHEWEPEASSLLSGFGCPGCTFSKGEEKIKEYLVGNGICFNRQKSFDDLKGIGGNPLHYDFYLPDYNLLIEYQGQFHDGTAGIQTQEGFEKQKENDLRKKEYVLKNKINFLEIWYYDFKKTEEILETYINNLKNPVTTTAI